MNLDSRGCVCSDCDKLKKEYLLKFGNLKKKIISTDLLLKKFNEKNAECVMLSKRFDESAILIERLQRDCTKCETELCHVLQEVEPLKKDNARLTGEVESCRLQLNDLQSTIEAAEKSREQLTMKLQLCENHENELRRQKSTVQDELAATKTDSKSMKRKLCRKYKAAAKSIVNFGRRLHSSKLLTRQLRVILARYEKELQIKNGDATSDCESDASLESDCESSGWRLEQNLLEDESDCFDGGGDDKADHQADLLESKDAEKAAMIRRPYSDVCLSPIWTCQELVDTDQKKILIDASNSPMAVHPDPLNTELLIDLVGMFTMIASPISPMPSSPPLSFQCGSSEIRRSPLAVGEERVPTELHNERDELNSNVENANMQQVGLLLPVEGESETPDANESQESSKTFAEESSHCAEMESAVCALVPAVNSTDVAARQRNSTKVDNLGETTDVLRVTEDELDKSDVGLSCDGVQEFSTVVSENLDSQHVVVALVSHDHSYSTIAVEGAAVERTEPSEAHVTKGLSGVDLITLSTTESTLQSNQRAENVVSKCDSNKVATPTADQVIDTNMNRRPDEPSGVGVGAVAIFVSEMDRISAMNSSAEKSISYRAETSLINSSMLSELATTSTSRTMDSPPRIRHFRVQSPPPAQRRPLVIFFKKGLVHDKTTEKTLRSSATKSCASFIQKGFLFPGIRPTVTPNVVVSSDRPIEPVETTDSIYNVSCSDADGVEFEDRSTAGNDIPPELQYRANRMTSEETSPLRPTSRDAALESTAPTVGTSSRSVDAPKIAYFSSSNTCQTSKTKKRSSKKSLRQKVSDSLKYKRRTNDDHGVSSKPPKVRIGRKSVQKPNNLPDIRKIFAEVILVDALQRPISPLIGEITSPDKPSRSSAVQSSKEFAFVRPLINPPQSTANRQFKRRKRPRLFCEDQAEVSKADSVKEGHLQATKRSRPEVFEESPASPDPVHDSPASPDPVQESPASPDPVQESPASPDPVQESPASPDPETTAVFDGQRFLQMDSVPESTMSVDECDFAMTDLNHVPVPDDGSWKLPNFLPMFLSPLQTDTNESTQPPVAVNAAISDAARRLKGACDDDPDSYERIADDICSTVPPKFMAVLVKKLVTWMMFTLTKWLLQSAATLRFTANSDVRSALGPIESKCMKLVLVLQTRNDWAPFEVAMMEAVHKELSKLRTKKKVNYSSLCRFFVALCRHRCELERARVLCYDFMFSTFDQCGPLIVSALAVCPTLFAGDRAGEAWLAETMRFVLLKHRDRIGLPNDLNSPDLFDKVCGVLLDDCSCSNLSEKLLANFKRGEQDVSFETVKSLELIAKIEGWEWTNNFLIRGQLWPFLRQWSAGNRTDITDTTVAYSVYVLGCLAKQCPHESRISALEISKAIRGLLANPSSSSTRVQLCVQEAACLALIMLLPLNPVEGVTALSDWIRLNVSRASPQIIQIVALARCKYNSS